SLRWRMASMTFSASAALSFESCFMGSSFLSARIVPLYGRPSALACFGSLLANHAQAQIVGRVGHRVVRGGTLPRVCYPTEPCLVAPRRHEPAHGHLPERLLYHGFRQCFR